MFRKEGGLMDSIQEFRINAEAQRICAMFHYGWISKKEIGPIERDINLFRDVQLYLSLIGYELLNPPGTEWYIVRLKKEFDNNAFDSFQRRNKALDRRHLALITIFYAKLIMPKKLGHVDQDEDIFLTIDELVFNYGEKFHNAKQNPRATIERLLRPLKKSYYIIIDKTKIYPGPALYMFHNDLLTDICEFVIQGITDNLKSIEKINEKEMVEENSND